jgi:hypothetical protein
MGHFKIKIQYRFEKIVFVNSTNDLTYKYQIIIFVYV